MKICALDLEMNSDFPLAIGLATSSRDGKLICIDQEGRACNWYVRKHIVTDPRVWEGNVKVHDALNELLELTKDYDIVYTWGKERKLLNKLGVAAYGDSNFPPEFLELSDKLVNAQTLFDEYHKLPIMYRMYLNEVEDIDWHNPLCDALVTLELAIMVEQSEKGID